MELKEITAKELTKQMKIGWNLGNTLDALGANDLSAEISWGNPKTAKENIDAVKKAGFNIVRIPVSWGPHLDENFKEVLIKSGYTYCAADFSSDCANLTQTG